MPSHPKVVPKKFTPELNENPDMSELEAAIRKKVKAADKFFADDDEKDSRETVIMVHPSPYTFVSRTSI